jgi:hypothetical protein
MTLNLKTLIGEGLPEMPSLANKMLRGDPVVGSEAAATPNPVAKDRDFREMSPWKFSQVLAEAAKGVGRGKSVLKKEAMKKGAEKGKQQGERMVRSPGPIDPNPGRSVMRAESSAPNYEIGAPKKGETQRFVEQLGQAVTGRLPK